MGRQAASLAARGLPETSANQLEPAGCGIQPLTPSAFRAIGATISTAPNRTPKSAFPEARDSLWPFTRNSISCRYMERPLFRRDTKPWLFGRWRYPRRKSGWRPDDPELASERISGTPGA